MTFHRGNPPPPVRCEPIAETGFAVVGFLVILERKRVGSPAGPAKRTGHLRFLPLLQYKGDIIQLEAVRIARSLGGRAVEIQHPRQQRIVFAKYVAIKEGQRVHLVQGLLHEEAVDGAQAHAKTGVYRP